MAANKRSSASHAFQNYCHCPPTIICVQNRTVALHVPPLECSVVVSFCESQESSTVANPIVDAIRDVTLMGQV